MNLNDGRIYGWVVVATTAILISGILARRRPEWILLPVPFGLGAAVVMFGAGRPGRGVYVRQMTVRHLMWASLVTGLIAVVWLASSLSDPAYYDPQTVSDYVASALGEIMFLAFAYTYVVWWHVTPVRRGVLMLPGAAFGFVLWSAGNVLEEIMGVEFGAWLFFVGAFVAFVLTGLAGVVFLTAPIRWRWSGLVLLGVILSLSNQDFPIAPIPWLAFAFVLWRGVLDEPTPASVSEQT